MYSFVLEWTPSLSYNNDSDMLNEQENTPYGIIFACFMLCITIGSWTYKKVTDINENCLLQNNTNNSNNNNLKSRENEANFLDESDPTTIQINKLLFKILIISSVSLLTPVFTESKISRFLSFCLFEINIGIFWPCLATLRSKYIPEDVRATLMNIFRIPLNFLVIIMLLPEFDLKVVFGGASLLTGIAAALQYKFMNYMYI